MVLDSIKNAALYANNIRIKQGFDFIIGNNLEEKEAGVYELGNGLKAIISEYQTKPAVDCVIESHQKYIDIQYLIKGEEQMGFTSLKDQVPTIPYSKKKDVVFYKEELSLFKLSQGMFAIFYPNDIHMPGSAHQNPSAVKKLVIKVPVE